MATYVVLLRGVNVGKAKRIAMADFKALLLELGCSSAATLLNSGNAVVTAARTTPNALAARIARALAERFALSVPVVVKTAADLDRIVRANELACAATDPSRLLVAFAQDDSGIRALEPLGQLVLPPERFLLNDCAAYLDCANGILESKAGEAMLGKLGKTATTRNWATVSKLHALAHRSRAPSAAAPATSP